MKLTPRILGALCALFILSGTAVAQDGCYVDYKAKRDGGSLTLHYGVIRLDTGVCGDKNAMQAEIAQRIGAGGWTLLRVLSTIDAGDLEEKRADAGEYFLRY